MMTTNAAGRALIKSYESCRLEAYYDKHDGWTIGWGHLSGGGWGGLVTKGMKITQDVADLWFERDISYFENRVRDLLSRKPTSNQFSAMVSLAYNIGIGNFRKSTCLRRFNDGEPDYLVASALRMWDKDDGFVVEGLVKRRQKESNLFMTPDAVAPVLTPIQAPAISPPLPAPVKSWWQALLDLFT